MKGNSDIKTVSDLSVLDRIRKEVRAASVYHVGGSPDCPVKLNQNESPYDLPPEIKEQLADLLVRLPINRYPTEQPDRLRHAIARHIDYDPDGILVGNGSNEITYTFGLSLIDPGSAVVLPRPMFSLYEKVARLSAANLIETGPREDLTFDADQILHAVERHDPSLVVLTTPNNPTGRVMKNAEVEAIAGACRGVVVVDEAYIEFSDEPSVLPMLDDHPNIVIMRTFSKAWGLAALRLGFIIGRPEVIREFTKSRIPFVVDPLAEAAGLVLLENARVVDERVARIKHERDILFQALWGMEGVDVVPSQANFVIFNCGIPAPTVVEELVARGVLIRDVSGYRELGGYCRVSAGQPDENRRFLAALNQILVAPGLRRSGSSLKTE